MRVTVRILESGTGFWIAQVWRSFDGCELSFDGSVVFRRLEDAEDFKDKLESVEGVEQT